MKKTQISDAVQISLESSHEYNARFRLMKAPSRTIVSSAALKNLQSKYNS